MLLKNRLIHIFKDNFYKQLNFIGTHTSSETSENGLNEIYNS